MSFAGACMAIFVFSLVFTWIAWTFAYRWPKVWLFALPVIAALLGGGMSRLYNTWSGILLIVVAVFAVLGALGSLVCQLQIMIRASRGTQGRGELRE